jgi:hypothetical protein
MALSTMRAAKHLQAIGHHLAHAEAHTRAKDQINDVDKHRIHTELASRHLDTAMRHGHRAGIPHSDLNDMRDTYAHTYHGNLPDVEHTKYAPHEHDSLIEDPAPNVGSANYKFEIGKRHPLNGPSAEETPLPAGAKIGTKSQHLEGLEHHAHHAALLTRKGAMTVDPAKSGQLAQAAGQHTEMAHAHGAHLGMHPGATGTILHSKMNQSFSDKQIAEAPDRFTVHPHDDKLNIDLHNEATKHHADRFVSHDEYSKTAQRHKSAALAHNVMRGKYNTNVNGGNEGPHSGAFARHPADVLIHPSQQIEPKDHTSIQALAHHIAHAAGHSERAGMMLPAEEKASHANAAEEHTQKAIQHGKNIGLKAGDVKTRIGYAKAKGTGVPIPPGMTQTQDHPGDNLINNSPWEKIRDRDTKPDHNEAMYHHIGHMFAHHDRSLHPEVESDTLTHAHHVAQASHHLKMAFKHGAGEGLEPHEIQHTIDKEAQQPHAISVPKDSYAEPHEHDKHALKSDIYDRGATKRLGKEFLTSPHSRNISTGFKHLKELDIGGPHANFSAGTKLGSHPDYGKVRLKPASDTFAEEEGADLDGVAGPKANTSAHREAAVHDLFHNHLGLGEHMHHVGLAHHKGELYSVHEHIPNHKTLQDYADDESSGKPSVKEVLNPHFNSGKLHHMAIGDYIVGNTDRHSHNVMVHQSGGSGKPIQLIDHGHSLTPEKKDEYAKFPSYLKYHQHHPATEHHERLKNFVNGLDADKLKEHVKSKGFSGSVADAMHYRVQNAKAIMNHTSDTNVAVKHMFSGRDFVSPVFSDVKTPERKKK